MKPRDNVTQKTKQKTKQKAKQKSKQKTKQKSKQKTKQKAKQKAKQKTRHKHYVISNNLSGGSGTVTFAKKTMEEVAKRMKEKYEEAMQIKRDMKAVYELKSLYETSEGQSVLNELMRINHNRKSEKTILKMLMDVIIPNDILSSGNDNELKEIIDNINTYYDKLENRPLRELISRIGQDNKESEITIILKEIVRLTSNPKFIEQLKKRKTNV